jgi:7-cyano-7-deazaguanine synthase
MRGKKMKRSAMVVLSGGQDSVTCLFWAKQHYGRVEALSFNYGQKHFIELEAARKVAELAGVRHEIVDVPILRGSSPLTNPDVELETYENYEHMDKVIGDRVEKTFVPLRNAFFLTLAANYAFVREIQTLVTGVCGEDNANYPDCRQAFITSQQETINLALGIKDFKIVTPLMKMSKAETVKLAVEIPGAYAALAFSHTSYDGKYPPTHNNHSNLLRAEGFKNADVPDPLVLRAVREGLMALPDIENYRQELVAKFAAMLPEEISSLTI